METLFTTDYYKIGIWVVLGLILASYIGLMILWNRKYVPYRRARGQATPQFGTATKRITDFAFKEDPRSIAPKKAPALVKKLLTLKTINWALLAITFLFIGINRLDMAWIPFLFLVIVIAVQTSGPLKQRDKILQRMYAVAASSFGYGKQGELNPWAFVRIKKWEGLTQPAETHLNIPANWDASSYARRDGLEAHFNTTVTDSNSWIYEWKTADGVVIARPISHLPERADYPGSEKHPWHVIPIGVGAEGEVTVDLTGTPHMLVCGTTGSGKSVLQRNLIFHCIQHNDMWRFLGVDVKRVEFKPFAKYKQTVLGIGTNLEDGVEIVRYAKEVMETRYEEMEERGVNHFKDRLDENGKPPYAIMLMVDEAYMFMATEGAKTDEGKMRDQLHGDAGVMLGEIARLGRASGVHLVLATQRPDATVIRGELKANLDIRIAAGRLDATPSSMVLDSGAATQLPGHIKGRGIVRFGGHQEQFQGYFAPAEWIDDWLEKHPGVEPTIAPARSSKTASVEESEIVDELEELASQYNFDDGKIDVGGETVENTAPELSEESNFASTEDGMLDLQEPKSTPTPVVNSQEQEVADYFASLGFGDSEVPQKTEETVQVMEEKQTFVSEPAKVESTAPSLPVAPVANQNIPKLPSFPTLPQRPSLPTLPQRPNATDKPPVLPPSNVGNSFPSLPPRPKN